MKRLLFTALLCTTLAGCAYDPYGPDVSGNVAFGTGGIYGGTVAVGASPLIVPVPTHPIYVTPPPPPRPIYVAPPRPHRPHPPAHVAPPPKPHRPALHPG